MKVIGHENVGMDLPKGLDAHLSQCFDKAPAVGVVAD
jgi:hypothetical protein